MKVSTLGSYAVGRDNNLNLIRFVAALMVIVAHSYPLSGTSSDQGPFMRWLGVDGGTIGVNIFFTLSGLLVTASYLRNSNIIRYIKARLLRIFPGLFLAVLVSAYGFGLVFTTEPLIAYVASLETIEYIIINSTLITDGIQLRYQLPGVFTTNPYPGTVNGSLWTLPYELWMYVLLPGLGSLGLLRRRYTLTLITLGIVGFYLMLQSTVDAAIFYKLDNFERFGCFFMTGVVLYINRHLIPIHWSFGLCWIGIAILTFGTPYYQLFFSIALIYATLWFGYVPAGRIRNFNRWGDYSYGLYIYAFPVQQSLIAFFPGLSPLALMISAIFVTFIFAFFSWHLVEKRVLTLKDHRAVRRLAHLHGQKDVDIGQSEFARTPKAPLTKWVRCAIVPVRFGAAVLLTKWAQSANRQRRRN